MILKIIRNYSTNDTLSHSRRPEFVKYLVVSIGNLVNFKIRFTDCQNSNRFDMDWHTNSLTLHKNNNLEICALLAFLSVFIQFNHYCLCVGACIGQEWVSS